MYILVNIYIERGLRIKLELSYMKTYVSSMKVVISIKELNIVLEHVTLIMLDKIFGL